MNEQPGTPIGLLRKRLDEVFGSAKLMDECAQREWDSYTHYSARSREAWRKHGDLLEAIRVLEERA